VIDVVSANLASLLLTMSYFLPHLPSGWHVDQAILSEEDRVVVIRFGHDGDPQCMKMDETLNSVSERVQNYAVIYLVDITEVPDFNKVSRICIYIWSLWKQPVVNTWLAVRCTNCMIRAQSCSFTGMCDG
jgi:thiol-disulfide isomerase/thioredoxin